MLNRVGVVCDGLRRLAQLLIPLPRQSADVRFLWNLIQTAVIMKLLNQQKEMESIVSITILDDKHWKSINAAFDNVKSQVRIVSPFIGGTTANLLVNKIANGGFVAQLITRFYRDDFYGNYSNIGTLEKMVDVGVNVYALKGLHAKLYIFDDDTAIVGSANFTDGGFNRNIELSLLLKDEPDTINVLIAYFTNLLKAINDEGDYRITAEIIDKEIGHIHELKRKQETATLADKQQQFGASLPNKDKEETIIAAVDIIEKALAKPSSTKKDVATKTTDGRIIYASDNIEFRIIKEVFEVYSWEEFYRVRKAFFDIGQGYQLWFPKLSAYENGKYHSLARGWINILSDDNNTLLETNEEPGMVKKERQDRPRIVFTKEGNEPYRFVGVFKTDVADERTTSSVSVHKRISKSLDLSPWNATSK
jgi:HKD family nuclease